MPVKPTTPEQVQRSLEAGARVIEHGHLIDEETAILMVENDVWLNIQPFLLSEEWMLFDDPFSRAKQEEMFAGTDTAPNPDITEPPDSAPPDTTAPPGTAIPPPPDAGPPPIDAALPSGGVLL